jgi:hypothetical protein
MPAFVRVDNPHELKGFRNTEGDAKTLIYLKALTRTQGKTIFFIPSDVNYLTPLKI